MDRGRDDEAERNKDSRETQRENSSSPLSPQPPSPTRQNLTTTTTTIPQTRNPHQHPIPPPIHPPFHAYTPQLNPPVSTPETMLERRNLTLFTPLPIADLYQPGGISFTAHQGVSAGSSLGAGPGAASPIPVGGEMHASGTSSSAAYLPPKGRYSLKKRESNSNPSVSTPRSSGVKSSRVQKSKKPSSSSGTTTPTPSAGDLSAYVDTMTDSLTETLANLQSAAQVIRGLRMEEERRAHARANSAVAGVEEEEEQGEEEEENEEE